MSEKLQQAITLIKSGKKQDGQQLLLQIIKSEPNNEQAWLWMSVVVSEDKRRYCLEKALSINPNNQQARQALAKLTQVEAKPTSPPPPSSSAPPKPPVASESVARPPISKLKTPPRPVETATPAFPSQSDPPDSTGTDADISTPEIWINRENKLIYITALFKSEIVSGVINPGTVKKFQAELQRGNFPVDMLSNKKVVPLSQITQVTQTLSSVRVFYTEANASKSTKLEGKDEEMAKAMIDALQKCLGSGFELSSTPMGRGTITAVSSFFMIIFLGITTFCYFGSIEASSDSFSAMGSARTRGIAGLLGLLGPGGVACIGGVLFLLILGVIVYYLVNPPLVTKLIPKEASLRNPKS